MTRHFLWIVPISLGLGALFSFLQPGSFWIGWLSFSALFLLASFLLVFLHRWAGGGRMLAWLMSLSFVLRLVTGVGVYLALPVDGYDEPDDRAGYFFTDAHRRDDQAWELAQSDAPLLSAFDKTYHTDQYGGLLAFAALAYRVFSPDAQRPILLILLSVIVSALGMPFFWRAARLAFGERLALAAGWILALYPESLLLGGAAMREPYLITFGALTLWGFVDWQSNHARAAFSWLGLGLCGMLVVSPAAALVTLILLAGWWWMAREHGRLSWASFFAMLALFGAGLFLLTSALNRQGTFGGGPLGVLAGWLREAVKWDVYQLKRGSGWVQKLFQEMPAWLRLPFVAIYGVFQPVLPAAFIEPTTLTWRVTGIARALGWYLMWPLLLYAPLSALKDAHLRERRLWLWISFIAWLWIILTALRGGGDQWDNPRYRTILLPWLALASGYAWTGFRSRADSWLVRIWLVEVIFLGFFTQWYLSRYYHIGGQIPFGWMVGLIIGSSLLVLVGGGWWDRRRRRHPVA
ncbi:MAG: hypothetical protein Fur0043_17400 [Anaerolineales bacterium]